MAADAALVEVLHDKLTMRSVRVWWDRKCLLPGQPWEAGFADGLFASSVIVPVLSKAGLKKFGELTAGSWCDNVLLSTVWRWSSSIVARSSSSTRSWSARYSRWARFGDGYGNFFADNAKPTCPRVAVQAVEDKLAEHLRRGGKGSAQTAPQTVYQVLDEVLAHQGVALSGARHDAVEHVVDEVVKMMSKVNRSRG